MSTYPFDLRGFVASLAPSPMYWFIRPLPGQQTAAVQSQQTAYMCQSLQITMAANQNSSLQANAEYMFHTPVDGNNRIEMDYPQDSSCTVSQANCEACFFLYRYTIIRRSTQTPTSLANPALNLQTGKLELLIDTSSHYFYKYNINAIRYSTIGGSQSHTFLIMANVGLAFTYSDCNPQCLQFQGTQSRVYQQPGRKYYISSKGKCALALNACHSCIDQNIIDQNQLLFIPCDTQCRDTDALTVSPTYSPQVFTRDSSEGDLEVDLTPFTNAISKPNGYEIYSERVFSKGELGEFVLNSTFQSSFSNSTSTPRKLVIKPSQFNKEFVNEQFFLAFITQSCTKVNSTLYQFTANLLEENGLPPTYVPFNLTISLCQGQVYTPLNSTGALKVQVVKNQGTVQLFPTGTTLFSKANSQNCLIQRVELLNGNGGSVEDGDLVLQAIDIGTWNETYFPLNTSIGTSYERHHNIQVKAVGTHSSMTAVQQIEVSIGCYPASINTTFNQSGADRLGLDHIELHGPNQTRQNTQIISRLSSTVLSLDDFMIWTTNIAYCNQKKVLLCIDRSCNSVSEDKAFILPNTTDINLETGYIHPLLNITSSSTTKQTFYLQSVAKLGLNFTEQLEIIVCLEDMYSVNKALGSLFINASSAVEEEWVSSGAVSQMFLSNTDDQVISESCYQKLRICQDAGCKEVVQEAETYSLNSSNLAVKAAQEKDSEIIYVNLNYTTLTYPVAICRRTIVAPKSSEPSTISQTLQGASQTFELSSFFDIEQGPCNVTAYALQSTDGTDLAESGADSIFKLEESNLIVVAPSAEIAFEITLLAIVSDQIKAQHSIKYEAKEKLVLPTLKSHPLSDEIKLQIEIDAANPELESVEIFHAEVIDLDDEYALQTDHQIQTEIEKALTVEVLDPKTKPAISFTIDQAKIEQSGSFEVQLKLGTYGTYLTNLYFFNITIKVTGIPLQKEVRQEPVIAEPTEPEVVEESASSSDEDDRSSNQHGPAVLHAKVAYWMSFLSSNEIEDHFKQQKPKTPIILPEIKIKPLSLKFKEINENSEIVIAFSQPCINPFTQPAARRNLLSIDQIDVQKEIMDIEFQLKSDQDPEQLEYYLEITKFDSTQMNVLLNFTNPLLVSVGQTTDTLRLKFKQSSRKYFVAKLTGESIELENIDTESMIQPIKRLFPKGLNTTEYVENAHKRADSIGALVIIQICLQVLMKGSLDNLWQLYFMMQLVRSLTMFQISMPSNAQLYISEIRKFVDFEMLTPDFLIQIFHDEDITIAEYLKILWKIQPRLSDAMPSNILNSGIQEGGITVNLVPFCVLVAGGLLVLLILVVLLAIKPLRKKIRKQIRLASRNVFFNGMIRGASISYLPMVLVATGQMQLHNQTGYADSTTVLAYQSVLLYAVLFPTVISLLLFNFFERLHEPYFLHKFSNLYAHLNYRKNFYSIFYYPAFFAKRLAWMMIPIAIPSRGGQQLQVLLFLTSLYIMWYVSSKIHKAKWQGRLELANEVLVLILYYHLITFSNFNTDLEVQFLMGYSFLVFLTLMIAVNVGTIAYLQVKVMSIWRLIARLKKEARSKLGKPANDAKIHIEQQEDTPIATPLASPTASQILSMEPRWKSVSTNTIVLNSDSFSSKSNSFRSNSSRSRSRNSSRSLVPRKSSRKASRKEDPIAMAVIQEDILNEDSEEFLNQFDALMAAEKDRQQLNTARVDRSASRLSQRSDIQVQPTQNKKQDEKLTLMEMELDKQIEEYFM